MLGVDQLPNHPADRSIATRHDDQGGRSDQLLEIHLRVELDDDGAVKGLAELRIDLRRHRAGLGVEDQEAGRALWGRDRTHAVVPINWIQRAQANE